MWYQSIRSALFGLSQSTRVTDGQNYDSQDGAGLAASCGKNPTDTNVISASHSKKFSSLIGPATIPSGGFNVSSARQTITELSD